MIYGPDPWRDQYNTVRRWRNIAYDNIKKSFIRYSIDINNLHKDLFIYINYAKDGFVQNVRFEFDVHGRFVDMGVGRGWPIGGRREAFLRKAAGEEIKKPRRRKQFYTKTIFREGHRLHEIMVKKYGIQMMTVVENNLDGGDIRIPL